MKRCDEISSIHRYVYTKESTHVQHGMRPSMRPSRRHASIRSILDFLKEYACISAGV